MNYEYEKAYIETIFVDELGKEIIIMCIKK